MSLDIFIIVELPNATLNFALDTKKTDYARLNELEEYKL